MVRACGSYPQCPGFNSLHRHHFLPQGVRKGIEPAQCADEEEEERDARERGSTAPRRIRALARQAAPQAVNSLHRHHFSPRGRIRWSP